MQLSVIIVNYNGEVFLKDCIESIHTHCATISHEVIIVDNNSQDNSLALVEKLSAPIKVIKNDENVGFSKANNIGVKASCGHNVLLLNNDTILCGNITAALDVIKD
jgi:GT2 family glycosyltransferase